MVKSLFVFVCCTALLAGSAFRQGRFNENSAAANVELMNQASERIVRLPLAIRDWQGSEIPIDDEDALRRGGGVSFLKRTYRANGSSESLNVLLMCGKPGPLSVHTPEVCYAGANYSPDPNQRRWKPTEDSEFTWQTFTSRVDGQPNLEIAWAWSIDGRWQSPTVPRLTFGREPYLYKLYAVRICSRESSPSASMNHLLADFIPNMQQTVFAEIRRMDSKSHLPTQPTAKSDLGHLANKP